MNKIEIPSGMETELFIMSSGALNDVPELMKICFNAGRPWIVADENTWRAAGEKVFALLKNDDLMPHDPYIFPANPLLHAESGIADMLARIMPSEAVPFAVGSGTINDLVKRAAGLRGKKYCCIATAPSVDGYTSSGAALSLMGLKKTLPCRAPAAVIADIDVLAAAPSEMLSGGYSDLLAKITAGADWIIVDALGLEPINQTVWNMVQRDLRSWTADYRNMENIFMGLAATGYAMQLYGESRPASGAEHLFSHVWEMENLEFQGKPVSHGFKVGVGTLASALLMEFVLKYDVDSVRKMAKPGVSRNEREAEIDALLIRGCYGTEVKKTALEKFLDGTDLKTRRELIWSVWEELRIKMREQLIPFDELRGMLKKAGCPTLPSEIGLNEEQFRHGITAAQLIRKRYTVLDLLYDTGLLAVAEKELNRIF